MSLSKNHTRISSVAFLAYFSSSLKYQLLDTESGEVMAKGLCERIGIDGVLTHTGNKSDEKFKFDIAMPTHKEAIQSVINILLDPERV